MSKKSNKHRSAGDVGEAYVVRRIRCPHCNKRLIRLPAGFPLFDVHCEGCVFRAQVKTNNAKPRNEIFGAGYDVLQHFQKSGQLIPPLIVVFRWREGSAARERVVFYPFLTTRNLRKRVRGASGSRPGYREFNYVDLETAPSIDLTPKQRKQSASPRFAA